MLGDYRIYFAYDFWDPTLVSLNLGVGSRLAYVMSAGRLGKVLVLAMAYTIGNHYLCIHIISITTPTEPSQNPLAHRHGYRPYYLDAQLTW